MSNYFEIEASLQNALQYKRQHLSASFRWLERQFHVKKDRIHRRWKGTQGSKSEGDPTNLKLDKYQEKAFSWYLTCLWEIGVPLRQKTIATAANEILAADLTTLRYQQLKKIGPLVGYIGTMNSLYKRKNQLKRSDKRQ
jgi:hypothetical protein